MKKSIFCLVFFGALWALFAVLMKFSYDGIPNVYTPSYETVCSVVYGASAVLFLLFGSLFLEAVFFVAKYLGGKKNAVTN